jgi:hypothetical protein
MDIIIATEDHFQAFFYSARNTKVYSRHLSCQSFPYNRFCIHFMRMNNFIFRNRKKKSAREKRKKIKIYEKRKLCWWAYASNGLKVSLTLNMILLLVYFTELKKKEEQFNNIRPVPSQLVTNLYANFHLLLFVFFFFISPLFHTHLNSFRSALLACSRKKILETINKWHGMSEWELG